MNRFLVSPSRPSLLSTLWVVLLFNYVYCDVLGLNDPAHLLALQGGTIGGLPFTPDKLVAAGLLMQIPIAMVLVARVVRRGVGRALNVLAAALMAATQVGSLFFGTPPTPVYHLFSAIEIALLIVIALAAITWPHARETLAPGPALTSAV